jgi:hypothetical protein
MNLFLNHKNNIVHNFPLISQITAEKQNNKSLFKIK